MEMICIERPAWELLVQRMGLLASEVETMQKRYGPGPRAG